jgi:hypothetical protein
MVTVPIFIGIQNSAYRFTWLFLKCLNLSVDTILTKLIKTIRQGMKHPISQVKDNILFGKDTDLFQLTILKRYPLDGGCYIRKIAMLASRTTGVGHVRLAGLSVLQL